MGPETDHIAFLGPCKDITRRPTSLYGYMQQFFKKVKKKTAELGKWRCSPESTVTLWGRQGDF